MVEPPPAEELDDAVELAEAKEAELEPRVDTDERVEVEPLVAFALEELALRPLFEVDRVVVLLDRDELAVDADATLLLPDVLDVEVELAAETVAPELAVAVDAREALAVDDVAPELPAEPVDTALLDAPLPPEDAEEGVELVLSEEDDAELLAAVDADVEAAVLDFEAVWLPVPELAAPAEDDDALLPLEQPHAVERMARPTTRDFEWFTSSLRSWRPTLLRIQEGGEPKTARHMARHYGSGAGLNCSWRWCTELRKRRSSRTGRS